MGEGHTATAQPALSRAVLFLTAPDQAMSAPALRWAPVLPIKQRGGDAAGDGRACRAGGNWAGRGRGIQPVCV
eukprot:scaffold4186_cov110-Isochrysis_galbana.AAC.3